MKKNLSHSMTFVFAVAVLAWMSGCKTVTSPGMTGLFAGRVALIDSTQIALAVALSDFSGATVSIDGTTFSATTDSSGQWEISGVPEGLYNITATKSGFGTFHWYEQEMVGGRLDLTPAGIARMPSFTPILTKAYFAGLLLGYNIPSPDSIPYFAMYCDLDSNTQPSDAHLLTDPYDDGYFTNDALRTAGAHSGETIYVSASAVFNDDHPDGFAFSFFDPIHNETRFASTGPKSNVIAVTMP
jgi:hypothetical protein